MESLFNEIEFRDTKRGLGVSEVVVERSKTNRYCPHAFREGKERKRMAIRMMVLLVSYIINTKFSMLKVLEPMRMR